jgi:hypothetical protein
MKYATLFFIVVPFFLTGCTSKTPATRNFYASYFTSAEALYEKIDIQGTRLNYTTFKDTANKCATWVQSTPCWTEKDLVTIGKAVPEELINSLKKQIEQTGFLDLDSSQYKPPVNQRYYSHKLSVRIGDRETTFVYYSYPGGPAEPARFNETVLLLKKFISEAGIATP